MHHTAADRTQSLRNCSWPPSRAAARSRRLRCPVPRTRAIFTDLVYYFGWCRCDEAMSSHKTLVKMFAFGPKHCMMTGGNQPTMAWTVTSTGRNAELLCYTIPYRSMNSVISSTEVENSFFFFFFFFFFLFSIPKQPKLSLVVEEIGKPSW